MKAPLASLNRARALAETTAMSLADIARDTGLSPRRVGKFAKAEKWQRPPRLPPRSTLVARLWHSAGQNLATLEEQLNQGATAAALKDLAVLAKVIRDLAALDTAVPATMSNEPGVADARAEIWRRMERMQALEL